MATDRECIDVSVLHTIYSDTSPPLPSPSPSSPATWCTQTTALYPCNITSIPLGLTASTWWWMKRYEITTHTVFSEHVHCQACTRLMDRFPLQCHGGKSRHKIHENVCFINETCMFSPFSAYFFPHDIVVKKGLFSPPAAQLQRGQLSECYGRAGRQWSGEGYREREEGRTQGQLLHLQGSVGP